MEVVLAAKDRTWNRAEEWKEEETEGGQNLCSDSSELYKLFTAKQVAEGTCCPGRTHGTRHPNLLKPERGSSETLPGQLCLPGQGPCAADQPVSALTWRQAFLRVPQRQPIPVQILLAGSVDLEVDVQLPVLEEAGLWEKAQGRQGMRRQSRPEPPHVLPGLSPRGSRWSPPDCARRASGGRTGW